MSEKYIHPAQKRQEEHEKKKEKKKKKHRLMWFLLLLLLIAALIGGIGFGQGWFDGKGKSDSSTSGSSDSVAERTVPEEESSSEDESSEAPKTPVSIKVSGSTFIYNSSERSLEDLKKEFSLLDKSTVIIEITDDNAVANAVQSLHDMLTELGLPYSDLPAVTAAPESSAAETTTTTTTAAGPIV